MSIDIDRILKIYDGEILNLIVKNINDVEKNIDFFNKLNFNDTYDIFERYTPLFLKSNDEFIQIFDSLINKYGSNYVEIIENDISILEEFL